MVTRLQVVHRVLHASPVDMIINPMDSRRFLQLGMYSAVVDHATL